MRQPTLYLPHGAGPCFFMEWTRGPRDTWDHLAEWLRALAASLPARPKALLVVSAHWEEELPTVTSSAAPALMYDYYGFPPHTYDLQWPAPGAPSVAARVQELLGVAGIASAADPRRGFDHGVFIPLKVAFPEAEIPTVALSLRAGLDPAEHLAIGRALVPLRDEGVLILGSGLSFHNMRAFMTHFAGTHSARFDAWLAETCAKDATAREEGLAAWTAAPSARESHPREEHLLPLMVVAGAAGESPGRQVFVDSVIGARVSAMEFGG